MKGEGVGRRGWREKEEQEGGPFFPPDSYLLGLGLSQSECKFAQSDNRDKV
jgi:hypothetical protein